MKKYVFILFFAILGSLFVSLHAQETSPLDKFLSLPALKDANVGVLMKNLQTGEEMASFRPNAVIPPASTMKLITAATALEMLGPDFRFSTYLETNGVIEDGVLKGDLYIRGTGDPSLGSQWVGDQNFLYKWIRGLRKQGIKRIEGNVIADMSFFDGDAVNPNWIWEDIGNYYAPGIFALSYLDNTMNVQLKSGKVGAVAEVIKTIPEVPGVEFENHIRCTEITYDGAFVHGVPYMNKRYLVGSVPSNRGIFGVRGDIPNPGLLLAQHFIMRMKEQGMEVSGEATYITESLFAKRNVLYEHLSYPLVELLKEVNQESNNHYAESIFRYLGHRLGLPCTINNSILLVRNYWKPRGIDITRCFVMDGCGLAPQDAISAEIFVELLTYMYQGENKDLFLQTLPVSGASGTLKYFCSKEPVSGKVTAKSGTTSRIKSYAGYLTLANGETAVFAVLVNNASVKSRTVQKYIESFLCDVFEASK